MVQVMVEGEIDHTGNFEDTGTQCDDGEFSLIWKPLLEHRLMIIGGDEIVVKSLNSMTMDPEMATWG